MEHENFLTEEERQIEDECEQERYAELYRDMEKEALQQGEKKPKANEGYSARVCLEEELKRNNADKNAYNQVGFNYDNAKEKSSSKTTEGKFHWWPIFILSRSF